MAAIKSKNQASFVFIIEGNSLVSSINSGSAIELSIKDVVSTAGEYSSYITFTDFSCLNLSSG
jgi:hypothetical protein